MGAIINDEGRSYIDLLGFLPHFCSILPFGGRKLFTGGAEKSTATREVAGLIRLTPIRLAMYCNVPCHREGSISRSANTVQIPP